jgi:hypothetical protein
MTYPPSSNEPEADEEAVEDKEKDEDPENRNWVAYASVDRTAPLDEIDLRVNDVCRFTF